MIGARSGLSDRPQGPYPRLVADDGAGADNREPWWWRRLIGRIHELTPERREEVAGVLFGEGQPRRSFLFSFALLQVLAVLLAVFGMLADSAAVVIGAMLVAPLMTPVLAISAALVLGRPKRQTHSIGLVAVASVGSVAIAWLLAWVLPIESPVLPDELLARTSPKILDLGVALAAGTAGAYATVRKEVNAALPGVAVAVALVPPLAAIGISLAVDRGDLAAGALLLYLTNLVAIVLAGAVVFLLTGFAPRREVVRQQRRVRFGLTTALVGVIAVLVPLVIQTRQVIVDATATSTAADLVESWLADTGIQLTGLELEDGRLTVDVAGQRRPPEPEQLASDLAEALGKRVEVRVRWTERTELTAGGG